MGKLTVNQVRVRLGKLMETVFTKQFRDEYENIAAQVKVHENAADVMASHLNATENYLKFVAKNLTNSTAVSDINSFTHPLVIYAVGVRYHCITCALVDEQQDETMIVPDADKDFFLMMFLQFFRAHYLPSL